MLAFAFNSHVGRGSDEHCLSGSACTSLMTSFGVTGWKNLSSQPTGAAAVNCGAGAPAVASRTPTEFIGACVKSCSERRTRFTVSEVSWSTCYIKSMVCPHCVMFTSTVRNVESLGLRSLLHNPAPERSNQCVLCNGWLCAELPRTTMLS